MRQRFLDAIQSNTVAESLRVIKHELCSEVGSMLEDRIDQYMQQNVFAFAAHPLAPTSVLLRYFKFNFRCYIQCVL